MSTLDLQSADLAALRDGLARRLARFRLRVQRRLVLEGAVRVGAIGLGLLLLSLLLDYELHLSLPVRAGYLAAALGGVAAAAWRLVARPLRTGLGPIELAAAVERKRGPGPALAPRIATVLQLPGLLKDDPSASPLMIAHAVRRSHELLRSVNFDAHLDRRRHALHAAALAALIVLPAAWAAARPATAGLWARRWFLGSSERWPQRNHLAVAGLDEGRLVVPRGEPYSLRVTSVPGSVSPDKVSVRVNEEGGGAMTAAMVRFAAGDFRYDLPPVRVNAAVRVWGGDEAIGPFVLEPVDRPRIMHLELVSQHPTQAQPQSHRFTAGDADLAFLPRTKLMLMLESNVPLAFVRVQGSAGGPAGFSRIDDTHFTASWTHERAVQMQVELVSARAALASLPTPVAVGLKTDQPPRVTLQFSGVRQRVTPQATIPLTIQAIDDYGLASVLLAVRLAGLDAAEAAATQPVPAEKTIPLLGPVNPTTETEFQKAAALDLASLKPAAGALVTVVGRAVDDCYGGPQAGASRPLTFRVVTPEELFRDILLRQQQDRVRFRKLLGEAESIRQLLETAPTPDAAASAARRHRTVQRETGRVAAGVADSLVEMKLNALGGPEAYDLLQTKIITPLRKLDQELLAPQRDALDALASSPRADDPAAVAVRQGRIVEVMREVLKQMAQWDSFVDVLNQVNEIIKLQTQVQEATEKLKEKQVEGLFQP